jgi:hypothetical protein
LFLDEGRVTLTTVSASRRCTITRFQPFSGIRESLISKRFVAFVIFGAALAGCNQTNSTPAASIPAPARNAPEDGRTVRNTSDTARTASDNTAVNRRDANADTKTPIDQKENQADINLTAKIRRQVLEVKDLSIDARNAKIITADGNVTLRGPVQSTEERETLVRIAREAAGEEKVDNQLEVAISTSTASPRR